MKAAILMMAIAGAAVAGPLNAQVLGTRPPIATTSRGTTVNGSWQAVGQDRNGNTIYERRTYDANGNVVVQRARRDANGNFSILSTRTERRSNRDDCQYAGSNGTVSDIIFGRNGTNDGRNGSVDCRNGRNDRRAVDGVWRQVGQGRNNNSVYERRTYDANGNIVVQKARRNSNGTFTILSTHTVRANRGARNGDRDDDDDRFDRRGGRDDDDRFRNSERHGNGRGKGHKGRH